MNLLTRRSIELRYTAAGTAEMAHVAQPRRVVFGDVAAHLYVANARDPQVGPSLILGRLTRWAVNSLSSQSAKASTAALRAVVSLASIGRAQTCRRWKMKVRSAGCALLGARSGLHGSSGIGWHACNGADRPTGQIAQQRLDNHLPYAVPHGRCPVF